mmetsp:Transcript_22359/g.75640  ORF Transcript_22359/g.75640 Transcript_22359/m.75640 type:complete len:212 (-) Transcript_22359:58-693(-)
MGAPGAAMSLRATGTPRCEQADLKNSTQLPSSARTKRTASKTCASSAVSGSSSAKSRTPGSRFTRRGKASRERSRRRCAATCITSSRTAYDLTWTRSLARAQTAAVASVRSCWPTPSMRRRPTNVLKRCAASLRAFSCSRPLLSAKSCAALSTKRKAPRSSTVSESTNALRKSGDLRSVERQSATSGKHVGMDSTSMSLSPMSPCFRMPVV